MLGATKVQVKIFSYSDIRTLEEKINAFIIDKQVLDVKFTETVDGWTAHVLYKRPTEEELW